MRIMVTGDLHLPLNLSLFQESVKEVDKDVQMILFAGDLIDSGKHQYLKKLIFIIGREFPNSKVYSVFGNNEYWNLRDFLKKSYPELGWLDDSVVVKNDIVIIGSDGVIDLPTPWQRKNIPNVYEHYHKKLEFIKNSIQKYKNSKKILLLTHYAPIYETCEGDPAPKGALGTNKLYEDLKSVDYAFHSHCHLAKIWNKMVGKCRVMNVSFYIHKKPLILEI